MEVLNLSLEEAMDYYIEALKMREENRLHAFWVNLSTSFGYKDVPEYAKFRDSILNPEKEEKKQPSKLGTYKGTDLTKVEQR